VRRALNFLLRNWPLKIGAVLLATVLYSGLVLGQNVRSWSGQVSVDAIRPPTGATLITELEPVTVIRFRAPLDVGVLSPDSFRATVDLSRVEAHAGGPPVPVPITVIALDQRVQIVDFQPREEQVQLDPVAERDILITPMLGTVPPGVTAATPQLDPQTATIRGASSRVNSVAQVVARVSVDASALNVNRDVDLVALDANGNQVPSIEIDPQRVHVQIAVAQELATRTLPVVPQLIGAPAPGYRVTSVTVEPLVVTVNGEAGTVSQLENAPTAPIDVAGRTTDLESEVGLALPSGVNASGSGKVRVVLTIGQETGTQTFHVGLTLSGEQTNYVYTLSVPQVNVTLSGTIAGLSSLDPTQLLANVDVAGVGLGTRVTNVTISPPPGFTVVSVDPAQITLTVTAATPSASAPSPATSP
jgi:YbbR domain-containing protein